MNIFLAKKKRSEKITKIIMVTRKENNAPCSKNFTNKTCWYSFTKQVVVIFGGFSYNSINVPKMLSHLVVKTNNELII